jgi:N-acetylmuramate 1-kinase
MEEKLKQIVELTGKLPLHNDAAADFATPEITALTGDGSQRQFFRVRLAGGRLLVAVFPSGGKFPERGEARSAWFIGGHLFQKEVPVPRPLAYDQDSGLLLFEDLGDIRLYDLVRQNKRFGVELDGYYRQAIHALVHMQIEGGRGFDVSWCWQTPYYDRQLMLERESGYFLQALCRDFLRLDVPDASLQNELKDIAGHAGSAPARYFLHRDYQSRNLMIRDGRVGIIDFQGGRLGPLGYDLASLLIDPYVSLTGEVRESLFEEYLTVLRRYIRYDPARFREEYFHLSLQRSLQVLGAFAFLGSRRNKPFFLQFIRPALQSLLDLLTSREQVRYPHLLRLVENCLENLADHGL